MEPYRGREPRGNEQEQYRSRGMGGSELREDIEEILNGVRFIRAGFENFLYGNRREGIRQIRNGLDEVEDGVGDILEDL